MQEFEIEDGGNAIRISPFYALSIRHYNEGLINFIDDRKRYTMAEKTTQSPAGYREVLQQNRDFRLLWTGEVISYLGDWFNLIASAALVGLLTESGLAVGGLFVIRTLAPFLVSPVAGVLADRYNRKRIMILSDVIRAITVLGFLFVREPSQVWLLYTLTSIQMGLSGFFTPARNAMLPNIVSIRELGTANALSSTTWATMLAIGAGLGGFVSGIFGLNVAFIIDAFTFLASAAVIGRIRYQPEASLLPQGGMTVAQGLQQYLDGLTYLRRNRDIFIVASHKGMLGLLNFTPFQVLQVTIAEKVFVIGENGGLGLGILFSIGGIGSAISPLVARWFAGDREWSIRKAIIVGYAVASVGLLVAASLTSFQMVLFGSFLRAMGGGIIWVFSSQLLLQLVPDQVRGRVFSTEFAFLTLAGAFSSGLIGQGIDGIGISGTIFWLAGLNLIPGFLWALWIYFGWRKPLDS